ncbi:Uncharacterized protein HZ326_28568 [Fusarium oxysporum f. sp. albedinis]|nr:Uncharacterized protein HZ326_28568 [Fusarium oxysporum f. sp. albedinis]
MHFIRKLHMLHPANELSARYKNSNIILKCLTNYYSINAKRKPKTWTHSTFHNQYLHKKVYYTKPAQWLYK